MIRIDDFSTLDLGKRKIYSKFCYSRATQPAAANIISIVWHVWMVLLIFEISKNTET